MKINTPKGTKDIFFEEIYLWHFLEETAKEILENANFEEIRTPIFEFTELFARGVGETTDIVNKEMYTFLKSDRSYSLRPENTAGVVRSYIQNGFFKRQSPQKLWYKGPMFRCERPQLGRQRQFHQIGVELFGIKEAVADAEVIILAINLFNKLNLPGLELNINNIGCTDCRKDYKNKLINVLESKLSSLCQDCQTRYKLNPLRLLDCKVVSCQNIYSEEPISNVINSDFICKSCSTEYENLKDILESANIVYRINKKLVRGLDYYNGAVFEISSNNLGSQNAVCGGGRYDKLIEILGGPSSYAVGWGIGMERVVALLKQSIDKELDLFIVSDSQKEALLLANKFRKYGISCDISFSSQKFGKQFEKADKLNAKYVVILGESEIKEDFLTFKNLKTGLQEKSDFSGILGLFNH